MSAVLAKARSRVSPVAIRRALYADRWVPRYRAALQRELNRQVRQIASEALTLTPDTARHVTQWSEALDRVKKRWVYPIVITGYELAGREVARIEGGGKSDSSVLGKADAPPPPSVSIGREEGGQFLLRGDFESIDRWVSTTSVGESQTSAKKLEKIWKDAVASRDPETGAAWTPDQISKQILRRGLVGNRHRADMLARTGAIWSVNEGAQQRYRAAGVKAERWLTTKDDARCPYCFGMEGKVVSIDEPFWPAGSEYGNPANIDQSLKLPYEVQHPPLHPRCRCSLIPVMLPGEVTTPVPVIKPPRVGVARKPVRKPRPEPTPTPIPEYKKAETLDEALQNVTSSFNNQVIVSSEETVGKSAVIVENVTESIDLINKEVLRLRHEYSQFNRWASNPKSLDSISVSSRSFFDTPKGGISPGQYAWNSQTMKIAQGVPGTAELKLGARTYSISGGQVDGVFRHETGHAYHKSFSTDRSEQWFKIYNNHSTPWWKENVSAYAPSTEKEAFAECFTAYTHANYGKAGTARLSPDIEKFLDIMLKGA